MIKKLNKEIAMPKTNVSLSKLDKSLFYNYSKIDSKNITNFIDDLIKYIKSELKSNDNINLRNYYSSIEKAYYLFLYESVNSVSWERFIKSIDNEKNISDNILENKSISYLLIIEENNT